MKAVCAILALCIAAAAAQNAAEPVPILRFNNELGEQLGQYNFEFESADGVVREEKGEQIPTSDTEGEFGAYKEGVITYKSPEGKTVTLRFVAGPNGYEPKLKISS